VQVLQVSVPCSPRENRMIRWIGMLLVSPLWGCASTQLFLQSWLALVNLLINVLGFVRGAVPRKQTAIAMGVAAASVALFSLLLRGGFWLLTDILPFGWSKAENVVYWIFAGFSALFMLLQIPSKVQKQWRNAMVPGSLESDIFMRKMDRWDRS